MNVVPPNDLFYKHLNFSDRKIAIIFLFPPLRNKFQTVFKVEGEFQT
jgi:hypothetical protein